MPRAAKARITPPRATGPHAYKTNTRGAAKAKPLVDETNLGHPCPFPDCEGKSSRHADIGRHFLSHASSFQYECPWPGCGKTIAQWENTVVHIETHSKSKRHQCQQCWRRLAASGTRCGTHEGATAGPRNQKSSLKGQDNLNVPPPIFTSLDVGHEEEKPQFADYNSQSGFWNAPEAPATYTSSYFEDYPVAGPSNWAAPQAFIYPPLEAGVDWSNTFDLDEARAPTPPPEAQHAPVPAFAYPPTFADVAPPPLQDEYVYVTEAHGHLYEPTLHDFLDVTRNLAIRADAGAHWTMKDVVGEFFTARQPTGELSLLNFVPDTSPMFTPAAEVAMWADAWDPTF
ncbi:uncharacterized protein B0H18DRAFT_1107060 [Fomitopsis serialis]|uniref:uncharacterized protein n=1 Tax=Fomitopsis serialis TaxID=139415 RepID=UPI002008821F|nr:uncharacterized protein B0H18DRAFT_1107060 [Neoantrodia serialis]KAH9918079.1 hypothetical protein B0H18DRAFT_1107060 [Neoantrodia serialis]